MTPPTVIFVRGVNNGDGHQDVLKAAKPKLAKQLGAVATLVDQELVYRFRFRLRSRKELNRTSPEKDAHVLPKQLRCR